MSSKLDCYSDAIFSRLDKGESARSIAKSLEVPKSTLTDFIRSNNNGQHLSDSTSEFTEIPIFVRDYTELDKLHVYPLGDLHIGSEAHADDLFDEWMHYLIKNKHTSLLNTGDNLDSAIKTSKSESYDATMKVGDAKRLFQRKIKPLADEDRVDIIIRGNHESRIYRAIGDCPMLDVAENLGVNYTASAAVIVYRVGSQEYEFYVRHGTGSANGMIGSRANQLQRQSHVVNADVYVSGHTHSQLVSTDNVFVREGNKMVRKRRIYVSSGSFCQYEDYASERAFVPGRIGAPRIYLSGTAHDVHVSI